MSENRCLDFYPAHASSWWFNTPPLCVINNVGSESLTIAAEMGLMIVVALKHPNIDTVTTFDEPEKPSLKQNLQTIFGYYEDLQRFSVTGRDFRFMCSRDKAKISYENNAQTDLVFDIANRRYADLQNMVDNWGFRPSPLAVLYTMCSGIIGRCDQIQSLLRPVIQHPMFKVETQLDKSENWKFAWSMEEAYKIVDKLKCWVSFGLTYREAFLQGQIHFSPEELLITDN